MESLLRVKVIVGRSIHANPTSEKARKVGGPEEEEGRKGGIRSERTREKESKRGVGRGEEPRMKEEEYAGLTRWCSRAPSTELPLGESSTLAPHRFIGRHRRRGERPTGKQKPNRALPSRVRLWRVTRDEIRSIRGLSADYSV